MHDWIEKGLLLGLGAGALTQEKSEAFVNELVERGEAHRDEASELVNRLTKRGEEERDALRKLVQEETERAVKRLDLATSKDIKALSRKIDALTKQLSEES
jgi:polyhydroxyalkanoate synthesis regulator phasin